MEAAAPLRVGFLRFFLRFALGFAVEGPGEAVDAAPEFAPGGVGEMRGVAGGIMDDDAFAALGEGVVPKDRLLDVFGFSDAEDFPLRADLTPNDPEARPRL